MRTHDLNYCSTFQINKHFGLTKLFEECYRERTLMGILMFFIPDLYCVTLHAIQNSNSTYGRVISHLF